ncbi:FAD-binding and (Fe-S)-binding domain-containing protein [Actinacidiphila sp. ITFR-21]|uniref:FAD-binding and (Fe-S)-binding domain-containing protein n=1 Tax=Actinacidiphila sp. ITFR-21 TaxID=3075199 RepID=UPI002889663B|nr:FAD-linked oxidase C-terminal domain-containing protein [Streptomyces sp. ITFR-21]WNI16473.1 FAD-linked oxidase C-terminal domain-containing protein [Streptomyces sp. ITFR-21]
MAAGRADEGLVAALRRAGAGEVEAGVRRRAEYGTDASNYRVVPRAVVFPREADEVPAVLEVCRSLGVPLTARGAGTSIAGNAVGEGVVLDFSRHMNRVLEVDPRARTAVVQPGAVLDAISAAAAPYGLRFGPDPSTHARATIGGSLGNNACGARALAYGRSADNTVELDVVTGGGVRFTARRLGRGGLGGAGSDGAAPSGGVGGPGGGAPGMGGLSGAGPRGGGPGRPEAELLAGLDALVRNRLALIRTEFGRFTRQVSGYSVEHLLPENGGDLAKFLVGTEGTLALLLQATVRLVQAPPHTAMAVLGYPDMATAADAVPALLPHRPVALEGMSNQLVDVLRARRGQAAVPDVLPRGGGWIFAETAGDSAAEAVAAARRLAADAGCLDAAVVTGAAARALWRIREDGAGLGGRTPAGAPAWPGWEDSAVPPGRLGPYMRELTSLMGGFGLDGLMYGHFGDGCLHVRIDFPLAEEPARFRDFMDAAAALAGRYGGSVSGEHGDGRARGALLHHMYSPQALDTLAAVKHLFDPGDVLNPGVIVRPRPVDADLRLAAAKAPPGPLAFAYPHDRGDFSTAVHRCVGVGKCRADGTGSGGVMCPSYLATRDEKDSTRGRARVLQELANGTLVDSGWRSPEIAESLDLCLSCKGCASDCPAGVDMATYKAEALHQRYRGRLRPAAHYALGWLPRWARLSARAPRLVNAVLGIGAVAALAKRGGGIDARRPLPRFATRTFRQWFGDRPAPGGAARPPVLLWADTFTDHFAPEVGRAAVRVLEHAGYDVRLTGREVCCGLTWISTGQLDGAKARLRQTLDALEPALAAGWPIVGLEPSCTAVLRGELTELLPDDPRAVRAATATRTLAELLTATPGWTPPDLTGVRGVAQPHCHQHAVLGWDADAALLRDGGAEVDAVGGCCGLAGNFGVEKGHYEVSVAVAETALLPAVRAAGQDAVVLADGFSCRTQLDQLAGLPGTHLAQLLASRLPASAPADPAR